MPSTHGLRYEHAIERVAMAIGQHEERKHVLQSGSATASIGSASKSDWTEALWTSMGRVELYLEHRFSTTISQTLAIEKIEGVRSIFNAQERAATFPELDLAKHLIQSQTCVSRR